MHRIYVKENSSASERETTTGRGTSGRENEKERDGAIADAIS